MLAGLVTGADWLLLVLSGAGLVTVTGFSLSVFLQELCVCGLTEPGLQITIPLLRLISSALCVGNWIEDEFPLVTLVFKLFAVRLNSERLEIAACAELAIKLPVMAIVVRAVIPSKVAF